MTHVLPPGVSIRPATIDDAPALHAALDSVAREGRFLASLQAPPVEQVKEHTAAILAGKGVRHVVLDDTAGKVIGWCDIVARSDAAPDVGIVGMGLLQDWRGRGIGDALLHGVLAAAAPHFPEIHLTVYDDNIVAQKLYAKLGFLQSGRADSKGPGGQIAQCWIWKGFPS